MDRIPWEALLTFAGMCVAGLAWLIRVEVKGYYTRRDVEKLERKFDDDVNRLHTRIDGVVTKHDEMIEKMLDKLSKIESMVAKIEGQLEK